MKFFILADQFMGSLVRLYITSIYHFSVCLKNVKQRPDRNGQRGGKIADPLTFFS